MILNARYLLLMIWLFQLHFYASCGWHFSIISYPLLRFLWYLRGYESWSFCFRSILLGILSRVHSFGRLISSHLVILFWYFCRRGSCLVTKLLICSALVKVLGCFSCFQGLFVCLFRRGLFRLTFCAFLLVCCSPICRPQLRCH